MLYFRMGVLFALAGCFLHADHESSTIPNAQQQQFAPVGKFSLKWQAKGYFSDGCQFYGNDKIGTFTDQLLYEFSKTPRIHTTALALYGSDGKKTWVSLPNGHYPDQAPPSFSQTGGVVFYRDFERNYKILHAGKTALAPRMHWSADDGGLSRDGRFFWGNPRGSTLFVYDRQTKNVKSLSGNILEKGQDGTKQEHIAGNSQGFAPKFNPKGHGAVMNIGYGSDGYRNVLWDFVSDKKTVLGTSPNGWVSSYSPNGTYLASVTKTPTGKNPLQIYHGKTGKVISRLPMPMIKTVNHVQFLRNSKQLLVLGKDKKGKDVGFVYHWPYDNSRYPTAIAVPQHQCFSVSPDGAQIAFGNKDNVSVYQLSGLPVFAGGRVSNAKELESLWKRLIIPGESRKAMAELHTINQTQSLAFIRKKLRDLESNSKAGTTARALANKLSTSNKTSEKGQKVFAAVAKSGDFAELFALLNSRDYLDREGAQSILTRQIRLGDSKLQAMASTLKPASLEQKHRLEKIRQVSPLVQMLEEQVQIANAIEFLGYIDSAQSRKLLSRFTQSKIPILKQLAIQYSK